jgi:nanoRNase/pAp phosphatase (c-di-AMP/oligoRNAs hydrolase)
VKNLQLKKTDFKEKVLLLTHENADLDAFCSALILQKYLKQLKVASTIAVPSHINEQTLNFVLNEKITFQKNPNLNEFETICLFDFNDYEQLGKLRKEFQKHEKKKKIIVFDHHEIEKRSIGKGFIKSKALSTTEILFELLGKKFDSRMAAYACLGMIEDTGRFIVGSKSFFKNFSKCLEKSHYSYAKLFEFSKHEVEEGEKIAFLKAIKRSQIYKINKHVIMTSKLNFYQGAAATKLLEFGAHLSLVIGTEKKSETAHLAVRANSLFREENNFNIMKHLLIPLQKIVGGEVGGHSGAAQWKGKENEGKVLKEAMKILEKKLLK